MNAAPGFHTMNRLVLPYIWSANGAPRAVEKIICS
jgi:hypothetical protein